MDSWRNGKSCTGGAEEEVGEEEGRSVRGEARREVLRQAAGRHGRCRVEVASTWLVGGGENVDPFFTIVG